MTTKNTSSETRIRLFVIILFLLTGLVTYKLFNLTVVRHSALVKSVEGQYSSPSALLAGRGNIYFSNLATGEKRLAVTNKSSFYLYSVNMSVDSLQEVSKKILPILNVKTTEEEGQSRFFQNQDDFLEYLLSQKDKSYLVIARNLTKKQAEQIKALKINGLTIATEINRYYTQGLSASHVLGFVGFSGNQRVGQYGIEFSYDDILSGESKTQEFLGNKTYSDILKFLKFWNYGNPTLTSDGLLGNVEVGGGNDVVLTIDHNIQSIADLTLNTVLKKWSAPRGSIIIEDPNTGAILAMSSSPSFDPNNYSSFKLRDFINPNVQEIFEPGSSFKPITMSAAVDSGAVTPDTIYNDTGEVKISGYTIRNFNEKASGIQTMRQALEHSLNTGAIFAQEKTGDDAFLNYVVGFGFGQKTGINLSGEAAGNISNLYSGRKINFLTASFGQGVAVSPLQLANAYSAIANGGKLMRPYLVKEIIRPDGTAIKTNPKILGAPITEKTSAQLKSMLVDVVDKGFDKAQIKGYDVAGKTGTAQIPDTENGGYFGNDQFIHDFVGFAPAYAPKFVILIKMEKPKGIKFAADSLSPVFGDIARYLIRYFNIPPTRN
ncbi:MAG: penicillin-binding protein 2 [Candidatus Yanofskybacteria bacterium]|nr:penicillin-binding protein 2 [Candidatus Yanofskybacteria bacterium]